MFVGNRGDEGAVWLVGDGAGEVAGGVAGEEIGIWQIGVLVRGRSGLCGRCGRGNAGKTAVDIVAVFNGVVGAEGEANVATEGVVGAGYLHTVLGFNSECLSQDVVGVEICRDALDDR